MKPIAKCDYYIVEGRGKGVKWRYQVTLLSEGTRSTAYFSKSSIRVKVGFRKACPKSPQQDLGLGGRLCNQTQTNGFKIVLKMLSG